MGEEPRRGSLGARIAQARERKGLSQRELAVLVQVSHTVISRLENGERSNVDVWIVRRIARVLGVGIDYLVNTFNGEQSDPNMSPEVALTVQVRTQPLVTTLLEEDSSHEYT